MVNHLLLYLTIFLCIFAAGGCHLLRRQPGLEPTPLVFAAPPSIEHLVAAVNANTQRVQSLQTRDARLYLRGLPAVAVDAAFEQPRRFRFRAGTGFTGQELDLGSNDELFWCWSKQNPQAAIFFARHDTFAASPNRSLLPIEPSWMIDALGIPLLDPRNRLEGPLAKGNGQLEIRARIPSAEGEMTKILTVHDRYAWVLQQQIFDARGRLLASAEARDHEYFPYAQVALPRRISIEIPTAQLAFQLETAGYLLNQPFPDSQALFQLPRDQFPTSPLIDIADPRSANPAAISLQPEGDLTPEPGTRYRGQSPVRR